MNSLTKEMEKLLSDWVDDEVLTALEESTAKTAKGAMKEIKKNAPSGNRKTNKYKNSFRTKKDKNSKRPSSTVYSTQPGLTHLLEHPHATTAKNPNKKQQTEAKPHWVFGQEYIEDNVGKDFFEAYKKTK